MSESLSKKGYDCFSPTYLSRKRWSDRTKVQEQPLFPGYIFSRLDLRNRLPILVTPGVIGIAGAGKTPLPVKDSEIEAIQQLVRLRLDVEPWPYLAQGERVAIDRGSLAGMEGFVVRAKNETRIVLSIHILQRSVAVEVDREVVCRVV